MDNFRVKKEEKIEAIFPGKVRDKSDMENSTLSNKVYETVTKQQCVNIRDRVTALDYWVCVLAFVFDLNFVETFGIVKDNNFINILIDRFHYHDKETKEKMENIRSTINDYIENKVQDKAKL